MLDKQIAGFNECKEVSIGKNNEIVEASRTFFLPPDDRAIQVRRTDIVPPANTFDGVQYRMLKRNGIEKNTTAMY